MKNGRKIHIDEKFQLNFSWNYFFIHTHTFYNLISAEAIRNLILPSEKLTKYIDTINTFCSIYLFSCFGDFSFSILVRELFIQFHLLFQGNSNKHRKIVTLYYSLTHIIEN